MDTIIMNTAIRTVVCDLVVACAYGFASSYQLEAYGEGHYRNALLRAGDSRAATQPAPEMACELAYEQIICRTGGLHAPDVDSLATEMLDSIR